MSKNKNKQENADNAAEPEAFDTSFDTAALATTGGDSGALVVAGADVPAWMQQDVQEGTEDLASYQSTPRLGLVQTNAKADKKAQYGEGSLVIFPDGIVVAEAEKPVVFVPIMFFATWEKWSDFQDKNADFILDSTCVETSALARKSKNRSERKEMYPNCDPTNPMFYRYVENLNFIVRIDSGPAKGEFATLSFNNSTHYIGELLSGMIRRRPLSIYANRVEITPYLRPEKDGAQWYGYKLNNPAPEDGGPVVQDQELYKGLKKAHHDFRPMVEQNLVRVNREGESDDADDGTDLTEDGIVRLI